MESAKYIFSAGTFIEFFVQDILDFTVMNKKEKNFVPNFQRFVIREAIDEIIQLHESKINRKNILVRTQYVDFPKRLNFEVKTDRKRLQQIILNLLSNAVKFTDQQGKITILVQHLGKFLRIVVSDNGEGIPKIK
jgi:signal transduction histidine kinase